MIAVCGLGSADRVAASAHSLGVSYPYRTLGGEEVALLQYVDLRSQLQPNEDRELNPRFDLLTAYEYGISDRLEIGLYLAFDGSTEEPLAIDGSRQRLRARFGEPGQWPVDVGFNLEVVEFRDALAFEETVIIEKRLGRLTLLANTTLEEEFPGYRAGPALVLGQTLGADLQLVEHVHFGVEYWVRAVLLEAEEEALEGLQAPADLTLALKYQNYLGPAISFQWERFWWTTSLFLRLDLAAAQRAGLPPVDERAFERLFVRSMLGFVL